MQNPCKTCDLYMESCRDWCYDLEQYEKAKQEGKSMKTTELTWYRVEENLPGYDMDVLALMCFDDLSCRHMRVAYRGSTDKEGEHWFYAEDDIGEDPIPLIITHWAHLPTTEEILTCTSS